MRKATKLSDEEFRSMINSLNRYVESEMDQWDLWKLNTSRGVVYISVSLEPNGPDEAHDDLTHIVRES